MIVEMITGRDLYRHWLRTKRSLLPTPKNYEKFLDEYENISTESYYPMVQAQTDYDLSYLLHRDPNQRKIKKNI